MFKGTGENKKTGGGGKAVASAIVPGLGQFCDGRNKEGATFLAGSIGLGILARIASAPMIKELTKSSLNLMENMANIDDITKIAILKFSKAKFIAPIAIGIATTCLWVTNVVDAYKGGKEAPQTEA